MYPTNDRVDPTTDRLNREYMYNRRVNPDGHHMDFNAQEWDNVAK
jgi:hypothetical protein